MIAGYKPALLELAQLYEAAHQSELGDCAVSRISGGSGRARNAWARCYRNPVTQTTRFRRSKPSVAKSPTAANRVALAQAYVKSKQPEKAESADEKVIAETPEDFDLVMFYGRLLRDQRKFSGCRAAISGRD